MNLAILPEFPTNAGLSRAQYGDILRGTETAPNDNFWLLSMIFGEGKELSHAAPNDFERWNRSPYLPAPALRYEPGTARYAAFALGYAVGVARWEAGLG